MFTTPLRLEATEPGRWVLLGDLIWHSSQERIVVPQGTTTDLASIPKLFRNILEQNGLSRRPAVLHDHLYNTRAVPRSTADAIFKRALAAEGMGWLGRSTYWVAVRLGGWMAWRNKTPVQPAAVASRQPR